MGVRNYLCGLPDYQGIFTPWRRLSAITETSAFNIKKPTGVSNYIYSFSMFMIEVSGMCFGNRVPRIWSSVANSSKHFPEEVGENVCWNIRRWWFQEKISNMIPRIPIYTISLIINNVFRNFIWSLFYFVKYNYVL